MDSLLVLLATGLVAHKFVESRKNNHNKPYAKVNDEQVNDEQVNDEPDTNYSEQVNVSEVNAGVEMESSEMEPSEPPGQQPQPPSASPTASPFLVGDNFNLDTLGNANVNAHVNNSRPGSTNVPRIGETILKRSNVNDEANFQEQFFPQDTRATGFSVSQKPWMRAVENSQKPPRTEREASFPTKADREDIHNTTLPSKIRDFENLQTERTIPRSREKHFESPVEGIATQNEGGGGLRGQRQLQRYHQFIFNDQPSVEIGSGPKGNFTGANKPSSKSQLDNTKEELVVSHAGIPVAASFKVGIPDASFELEGSNAEAWLMDQHRSASRAPVEKSNKLLPSFSVAHDDGIESFKVSKNSNLSRSSRPKPVQTKSDKSFKDASITTQTVVGAPGGSRLLAINKSSEVRAKAKNETLSLQASEVDRKASSKSSGPGALVVKPSHEHTDEKLAEEDTANRVRGVTYREKSDALTTSFKTENLTLNQAKARTNEREFTSKNFAAPQNTSLPPHLRIAPTSSLTATSDMTFKDNAVDTQAQNAMKRGKTVKITHAASNTPLLGEPTSEQRRVNLTLLTDRMASGDALKLLSNPYSRPGSNRLQIDV